MVPPVSPMCGHLAAALRLLEPLEQSRGDVAGQGGGVLVDDDLGRS